MAQRDEPMQRSVRNLQLERHTSDMISGAPRVVEIDLTEEERKSFAKQQKTRMHTQTTMSQQMHMNQHPFANSPTIKNSLIDWVTTFKNLPRFPGSTSEFVTSGALYFIMEEIEPEYFSEFPYKILNKQEAKTQQDPDTLR